MEVFYISYAGICNVAQSKVLKLVFRRTFVGMLYDEEVIRSLDDTPKPEWSIMSLLNILPGYEQIVQVLPGW